MRRQHRQALIALLEGPINTTNSVKRAGISAWSQRAGDLERMGLVVRYPVEVSEFSRPVVEAKLTDKGRAVAQALARGVPEPTGAGERQEPHPAAEPAPEFFTERDGQECLFLGGRHAH